MTVPKFVIQLATVWALAGTWAWAAPSDVGMVLVANGAVEVTSAGKTATARVFQYLKAGDRLSAQLGGKFIVTHYGSNAFCEASGPTVVEFTSDKVQPISGNAPLIKPMAEAQLKTAKMSQSPMARPGSVGMRSLVPPPPPPEPAPVVDIAKPAPGADKETWLLYAGALAANGQTDLLRAAVSYIEQQWPELK